MLWQKSWWESRISFWTFLVMVSFMSVLITMRPPRLPHDALLAERLQRSAGSWNEEARRVLRSAGSWNEEARQNLPALRSFLWQDWVSRFNLGLTFLLPVLAMSLATFVPGCASPWTGRRLDGGRIFMLSLPVSRRRILLTQAAMGCGELWLIAVVASLLLSIMSLLPSITAGWEEGYWYSVKDALIFASLSVLGALVFYFLTLLMTVIFDNGAKSVVFCIVVYAATRYPYPPLFIGSYPRWNINRLITGEDYFLHGQIPWLALSVSLLVSALLLFGVVRVFERRDF